MKINTKPDQITKGWRSTCWSLTELRGKKRWSFSCCGRKFSSICHVIPIIIKIVSTFSNEFFYIWSKSNVFDKVCLPFYNASIFSINMSTFIGIFLPLIKIYQYLVEGCPFLKASFFDQDLSIFCNIYKSLKKSTYIF